MKCQRIIKTPTGKRKCGKEVIFGDYCFKHQKNKRIRTCRKCGKSCYGTYCRDCFKKK